MIQPRLLVLLTLPLLACTAHGGEEKADWSVELPIGDAYNAESRTQIKHDALGNSSFNGDYDTRGMEGSLH